MKFKIIPFAVLFLINVIFAQAQAPDKSLADIAMAKSEARKGDTISTWVKGGLLSFNIAQGSTKNWAAGAEPFSLTLNTFANIFANKIWGKYSWDNNLDLAYGLVNTTSLGLRKNNDIINLTSRIAHQIKGPWNLAGLFNFRSQFTSGYQYSQETFNVNGQPVLYNIKKRSSGLFAPAYITLAPGINYIPNKWFNIFYSPISLRGVIVSNDPYSYVFPNGIKPDGKLEVPLATAYGVDPIKKFDLQFGSFLSANLNKEIFKNITLVSRLDLFSNYRHNPENIQIYLTNALVMKVNKYINVTYNLDMIYDDNIKQFGPNLNAPRTQTRSLLGIGLSAKL